jgi:8-amino-7-oxononanoate synthase
MRGAAVRIFPHHDPTALKAELGAALRDRAPVVVTDGFCPSCGRVAPLADYQALTRSARGWLVVDDTQALGILGHSPSARMPYGRGGGGSLRWSGISGPETLVFSSLAKGFGAPLAVLAGSKASIGKFEEESLTRVHCSPPSIAALHAAERAVSCNRRDGEARRAKLLELVRRFRRGLSTIGVIAGRGLFPVQTLRTKGAIPALELHRRLADRGVHAVLNRAADGQPRVSFILTSRHTSAEIDAAVTAVAEASRAQSVTSQEVTHEEPVYH